MSTSSRGRSNYAAVTNRTWQILWQLLHKRFHSFSLFYFLPSVYVRSCTCASVGVLFMSVFMRMWIGVYYKQQIPPNCHWCRRALMSKRGWMGSNVWMTNNELAATESTGNTCGEERWRVIQVNQAERKDVWKRTRWTTGQKGRFWATI